MRLQYIEEAAVAARRVQLGIGLRPQDRYIITTKTPEDEAIFAHPERSHCRQRRQGWASCPVPLRVGADGSAVTMTPDGWRTRAERSASGNPNLMTPATSGRSTRIWQHSDDGTQSADVGQATKPTRIGPVDRVSFMPGDPGPTGQG